MADSKLVVQVDQRITVSGEVTSSTSGGTPSKAQPSSTSPPPVAASTAQAAAVSPESTDVDGGEKKTKKRPSGWKRSKEAAEKWDQENPEKDISEAKPYIQEHLKNKRKAKPEAVDTEEATAVQPPSDPNIPQMAAGEAPPIAGEVIQAVGVETGAAVVGEAAGATAGAVGRAAGTAAGGAGGGMGGVAAGVTAGAPLGPPGMLVGALVGYIAGQQAADILGKAFKALADTVTDVDRALLQMSKDAAKYNAEVAQAQAVANLRDLVGQLKRAERVGPQLAEYTDSRSQLAQDFHDAMTDVSGPVTELMNSGVELLRDGMDGVLVIAKYIEPIYNVLKDLYRDGLEIAKDIPGLGYVVTLLEEEKRDRDLERAKATNSLLSTVRDFLDPEKLQREFVDPISGDINPEFRNRGTRKD